jgi:hypothetical protein
MFLITYDEHGGFYDHVNPKDHPCQDDAEAPYGVRVPALVVSPYAKQHVSKTVFDHTSIPKTILSWFADDRSRDEAFEKMGPRTRTANDLGGLIPLDQPRDGPIKDLEQLRDNLAETKAELYREQYFEAPTLAEMMFSGVSDLQAETVVQAAFTRDGDDGVRPGKP